MNQKSLVEKQIQESIALKQRVQEKFSAQIVQIAQVLSLCLKKKKKIFFCGNGGSAADAIHLAAELLVRLSPDSKRKALPAIALNTNVSTLTACANDFGFEQIFSRQIEALGQKGDFLFTLSTSGKSRNLIEAAKIARKKGMKVIGFLGNRGGGLSQYTDYAIIVPSPNTPRIQEVHIMLGHIVCDLIERELFEKGK
ncbi:MAG: phosphoheptose isomerase [candidate division Zixibacteria bacterium RBG_16_40_9]|nr:MAG: phosphoheptose isomerase [candidate division Zixibacteria bacterium RBG_16_40_9]